MSTWLPSIPYHAPRVGYWHPVTSTLNFCEEDYYATIYSAEIVNSLTNVFFMYLAYRGYQNCLSNNHDTIFLVAFVGCFLVAIGSFLFHSTLKYPMQLVDELSMIYTTCLIWYAIFSHRKSPSFRTFLGAGLVGFAAFVTFYYHYLQEPAFHQIIYALLTAVVVFRSVYVMEVILRPKWRRRTGFGGERKDEQWTMAAAESQEAEDKRDIAILRMMWIMVASGLSVFLGGFVIWSLDNRYCSGLRRWRHWLGLPWGILLEGHGWWHFMTGLGAYYFIVWGIWLRHCLNGRQDEFRLHWPHLMFSLPQMLRVDSSSLKRRAGTHQDEAVKKGL